jgi:hypothetical protein
MSLGPRLRAQRDESLPLSSADGGDSKLPGGQRAGLRRRADWARSLSSGVACRLAVALAALLLCVAWCVALCRRTTQSN